MEAMTLHRTCRALRCELCAWQRAALGLMVLATLWNGVQTARINRLEDECRETAARLEQAEYTRDRALEKLGGMVLQAEEDRQARAAQAAACDALDAYQYVGECTITAYCPCEACCGRWADGITASGLPAEPGIVAVDPDVIPLGSAVIIDGQRYLAADTGVRGMHVDVYLESHDATEAFGVRTAEVWIEMEE